MVLFKCVYKSELRRVPVPIADLTYELLLAKISKALKVSPDEIVVKYVDDDEDRVTMSCDEDLLDAMELHEGAKSIRLFISKSSRAKRIVNPSVDDIAPVIVYDQIDDEVEALSSEPENVVDIQPLEQSVLVEKKSEDPADVMDILRKVFHDNPEAVKRIASESGFALEKILNEPVVEEVQVIEEKEEIVETIHEGIMCDICKVAPIRGNRYKCTICNDFDICGACEAQDVHPSGHPLLKIKTPKEVEMEGIWRRKTSVKEVKNVKRDVVPADKIFAKFIKNLTIPDRSYLAPGDVKEKVWRLQNSGPMAWPAGVKIQFVTGEKDMIDQESFETELPVVPSGERVDVRVKINVPERPGRYIAYFRLQNLQGVKFGPRIWVDFFVPENEAKEEPEVVGIEDNEFTRKMERYGERLLELESMGFGSDASLNIFLLDKFKGDITKVVNWYLDRK